tara:strand:- start:341 stop:490 length:150 start_codon:yes stop_codon:yes gene_type:complete
MESLGEYKNDIYILAQRVNEFRDWWDNKVKSPNRISESQYVSLLTKMDY